VSPQVAWRSDSGASWLLGGRYGFTFKKRTRQDGLGVMFTAGGEYLQTIITNTPGYYQATGIYNILIPLTGTASLYINGGKFDKDVGTFLPFFGVGAGFVTSYTYKDAIVSDVHVSGHLGTEFVVLPPAYAVRLCIRGTYENLIYGPSVGRADLQLSFVAYLY
jgi:hypothetical protein